MLYRGQLWYSTVFGHCTVVAVNATETACVLAIPGPSYVEFEYYLYDDLIKGFQHEGGDDDWEKAFTQLSLNSLTID